MKKHWYTTVFGFLAAAPQLLATIGVGPIGHIGATSITGLVGAIGVAGLGAVAADAVRTKTQ